MNELKLLKNKTIEEVIEYIIEKYHNPLPEMIEDLNEKGRAFFYGHDNMEYLIKLRDLFFHCTGELFTHIIAEEEEQFPLLITKINNPEIEVNLDIIGRITSEHDNFDDIILELEKGIKNINISEEDECFKDYNNLLIILDKFVKDTLEHIKIERELLEDFVNIMSFKGIEFKI